MDNKELGQLDYFRNLAVRLKEAGHGDRKKMINKAMEMMSMSHASIYRNLSKAGFTSGRKTRSDKGQCSIDDKDLMALSNLMLETTRRNGKRLMGIDDAMSIALHNNMIEQTTVQPQTALRIMRERGIHPDQLARPTPHIKLRSLYPNHVWQFDVSVCVLYYLDGGGLCVMDEKKFYKNKPQNIKKISNKRVLRYLITDHFSGALYLHYFQAAGEDQETLFHFLMMAFAKRDHDQDPFHGVPMMMIWDAGSANQSFLIKNLLDRLTVKHQAHTPGVPRAKGQVEVTHNIVERKFESRLSFTRVENIDQLNRYAHIWMRHFNGVNLHSRHGHPRYGLWQTIRQDQLRIAPDIEICQQLLNTRPEKRKVRGDLTVTHRIKGYERFEYSLAHCDFIQIGEHVEVCVNPYRAPNIDVIVTDFEGEQKIYECSPIKKGLGGFDLASPVIGQEYKRPPDTEADKVRKSMKKQAYDTDTLEEAEAKQKKETPAFDGIDSISYLEHQTRAHYMQRKGEELPVERPKNEIEKITLDAAAMRLAKVLDRPIDSTERDLIKSWYPDGIPADQVTDIAKRISQPDTGENVINLDSKIS